jgi:hypothetical protein
MLYLSWRQTRLQQRNFHGSRGTIAVGRSGCNVTSIGAGSVAYQLSQRHGTAGLRVREGFDDRHACASLRTLGLRRSIEQLCELNLRNSPAFKTAASGYRCAMSARRIQSGSGRFTSR